ncbi:glycosyltransferase [Beijerinckia sp. L45]|uniref:glycosyltransferase n=1 Tax=Beijerinckia sp. L45 TaxID=1641855 RepID=UPI001FEF04F1|nr:glycosyltransferase [Beijerinckia sp. L45]
MRILHVLRAPLGGLFRHVLDLTREQVARGHAVGLVVDSLTGGDRATDNLAKLEPILELGILRIPMRRAPHLQDIGAVMRVDAHARQLTVHVIHGHGSKGGLYARLPGYLPRAFSPIRCYTPHGGSFNHIATPVVQATYMTVERLLAARTDVLLFESVFIANRFHQRVGDTQALVRIVQNGINPDEFTPIRPKPDAADFVYVGELRSAKGIDTLIDATAALSRRRGEALKLILVGSGPDEQKLIRQAEAAGIAAHVTFPGAMPAPVAFTLGKILVIPSRAESLPYIVLEAAGAQIPMIATDVGGINEVFGPYRERLIVSDNPALLAQSMERMLDMDPAERRQQAEELAAFASTRFSIANMADAVIAGYRDAFARRALTRDEAKRSVVVPS